MYAPTLLTLGLGTVVDRLAEKVEYTSESAISYGHRDAFTRVARLHSSGHTVGTRHSDAPDDVVSYLAGNLADELRAVVLNLDSVEKVGKMPALELDIKNRTDYLYYFSDVLVHLVL